MSIKKEKILPKKEKVTLSEKDHYINFDNELSGLNAVYLEVQHDFTHTPYWTSTVAKGETVHYRPYFQSYDYTMAVYQVINGKAGNLIAKYQYASCENNSVTLTISGSVRHPQFQYQG